MCTLLVTGAAGFTGAHLLRHASAKGYRCIALTQSAHAPIENAESTLLVDLRDARSVAKAVAAARPDVVVHLAAVSHVAHGDVGEIYGANVAGTVQLVDALSRLPSPPLMTLVASSANVYGNARELPITEDTPVAPVNDYGVSKVAMEMGVRLRADRLPVVVVRPFNYTGVGQSKSFLVPKLVEAFRQRAPRIRLGNTAVSRDFSDVRDVVEAYVRLLEAGKKGATFNVCSGTSVALDSVIRMLEELTGHSLEVERDEVLVRRREILDLYGSDARLREVVGQYRSYDLRSTLQWMLEQ